MGTLGISTRRRKNSIPEKFLRRPELRVPKCWYMPSDDLIRFHEIAFSQNLFLRQNILWGHFWRAKCQSIRSEHYFFSRPLTPMRSASSKTSKQPPDDLGTPSKSQHVTTVTRGGGGNDFRIPGFSMLHVLQKHSWAPSENIAKSACVLQGGRGLIFRGTFKSF